MSDLRSMIVRGKVVAVSANYRTTEAEESSAVLQLPAWLLKVGAGETATAALPAVWLSPEDDPALLAPHIHRIALIAVHFPRFVEGRGYSAAYLLRQRFGFRGELRAFGDLGRDHVWQLARVGFDAFDLRDGTDLVDALEALRDFPERYQASVDEPRPLFRRREMSGA